MCKVIYNLLCLDWIKNTLIKFPSVAYTKEKKYVAYDLLKLTENPCVVLINYNFFC